MGVDAPSQFSLSMSQVSTPPIFHQPPVAAAQNQPRTSTPFDAVHSTPAANTNMTSPVDRAPTWMHNTSSPFGVLPMASVGAPSWVQGNHPIFGVSIYVPLPTLLQCCVSKQYNDKRSPMGYCQNPDPEDIIIVMCAPTYLPAAGSDLICRLCRGEVNSCLLGILLLSLHAGGP
jgi:hypothetical protein